jgi:RNA polymerase sigma factor (sigma-70 family)
MQDQYKNLTPRRKEMLEMRSQGKTLEEIGNKFGISRERVRQIIKKANGLKAQES